MLHVEVVGVPDGTNFRHDQEVARRNRMDVLKRDDGVVLIHNVSWLLFSNNPRKNVLLGIAVEFNNDSTQTNQQNDDRKKGDKEKRTGVKFLLFRS